MTLEQISALLPQYLEELHCKERASSTLAKYKRDIEKFLQFAASCCSYDEELNKDTVLQYKKFLTEQYQTGSINSYLTVLNQYFTWLELPDLKVKTIRQQQRNSNDCILSRSDYERLLRYAKKLEKEKLYCIMRTLGGTGIRIEELKFITAEAVKNRGYVQVQNKGKLRDIVIPPELCKLLRQYCMQNGIQSGIIFHGKAKEKLVDKSYLWREMKYIAGRARVNKKKVHANSFRHLFAKTYLEYSGGNIIELADLLGHSSLETTRIYTRTSNQEKRGKVAKLGL